MDYTKVRKWQVEFAAHRAFSSLPLPDLVVEEVQTMPSYRLDGRKREDRGGQMVITIGGRGGIRIGDDDHELPVGMAFLHNHQDRDICYYYPKNGTEPWNFLWFSFDGPAAEAVAAETTARYGHLFQVAPDSELVSRLMNFKNYAGELQVVTPLEGARLFYELLTLLCASREQSIRSSRPGTIVGEVQHLVAGAESARWKIDDLARRFQLSREHLSRLFREQTGMTLQNYMMRQRFLLAVDLLLQTRLTGKEIADRCGWNDYAVFSRIFKKRFGMPPGELRESGIRPCI